MFLAALFIIAQEWKEPKDPSADEWIKKIHLSLYAGDLDSIPELGRSSGEWLPTPVFLSGEACGQRSLAGFSPWGHKE